MLEKEKKFQMKLWLGATLGSIIAFILLKLVWKEASYSFLLVLLLVSFFINLMITTNRSKKLKITSSNE